jgi:transposase
VRTDKVDARILAELLAADFLPPVWLPEPGRYVVRPPEGLTWSGNEPDSRTRSMRSWRATSATPPVSDLFGKISAFLRRTSTAHRHACEVHRRASPRHD